MDISLEISEGRARLSFAGRLTVSNAASCCAALREARAKAPQIAVAFGAIEAVDLSFLQLLCAAHRTAAAGGGEIVLSGGVPEPLERFAELAGVEQCAAGPPGCLLRALRREANRWA